MTQKDSWLDLAHEPTIRATGLDRIQERAPRLRVTVELSEGRIRLGFGDAILDLATGLATSLQAGRRSGVASILPPTAGDADAILAAVAGAVDAEVPPRPHAPGFRPPVETLLEGIHAASGRSSLVWISIDPVNEEGGAPGLRLHLLLSPGKPRAWLHVELPRGAARRAEILAAFARGLRDGGAPRSTPATDLRCASETPWLANAELTVPEGVDLASASFGGSALFAARRDGEATVLLRIDGPGRVAEVARVEAADLAFYPSPTGAHVLLESRWGAPHPLLQSLTDGHAARELLDVATGQRTKLVEKHGLFAFGDTSSAAVWSPDGRQVAMSGSTSLAGGTRSAVLVYDVPSGAFVDATPAEGTFLVSHWDGAALWLHGDPFVNSLAFRWEPGRSGPRADACLGRVSPSGRFVLVAEEGRARVVDRRLGATTMALPASLGGRFWAGGAWVTDEDEPRVFDLATGRYRYLAPAGRVARAIFAETAPLAIFHDGTRWQWGSAPALGSAAALGPDPVGAAATRRALAERMARRIEEASILAEEDATGEARRALAALEARLRAEASLEAGTAKGPEDSDDAAEAALAHYEAAVRASPDFYEALHDCAVALAQLGRTAEQARVAGYLCERFPISSEAWLTRSIALQKEGDTTGAQRAIDLALALDAEGADLAERRARTEDLVKQRAALHATEGRPKAKAPRRGAAAPRRRSGS